MTDRPARTTNHPKDGKLCGHYRGSFSESAKPSSGHYTRGQGLSAHPRLARQRYCVSNDREANAENVAVSDEGNNARLRPIQRQAGS
jgi:hypothetical protein